MRRATNIPREKLLSLGTCFGKFTKSGKFRLHVTALDYISQYAQVMEYNPSLLVAFYALHSSKYGSNHQRSSRSYMGITF